MKRRIQNIQPCKRVLEVEIPADIVTQKLEEVYKEIGKTVRIPGFRTGKAPRDLLEKYYNQRAKSEVASKLVPRFFRQAVEEAGLIPLNSPEIQQLNWTIEKSLIFKATFEVKPEVNIGSYRNLRLKKRTFIVSEEDVQRTLELLRQRNAEFAPVENRGLETGDYICCDFKFFVDNKLVNKREDYWFQAQEDKKFPGFIEKLLGAKPGERRQFLLTLPRDFSPEQFAGKQATFQVDLKEIKSKILPDLDDEFARDLKQENLEGLKKAIREDLIKSNQEREKEDLGQQIIERLLENSSLQLPHGLLESHAHRLLEDYRQQMLQLGVSKEELKLREKELQKGLTEKAERQLKVYFILDRIAKQEDIQVEEAELESQIQSIAAESNWSPEETKREIQDNNLRNNLLRKLKEKKTIEFLIQNSKIE